MEQIINALDILEDWDGGGTHIYHPEIDLLEEIFEIIVNWEYSINKKRDNSGFLNNLLAFKLIW